jgi:hypothetical protein
MERALARRWAVGLGLLTFPWLAYPGNWTSVAPSSPAAVGAWTADSLLVYAALFLGLVWMSRTTLTAIRWARYAPPWSRLRWLQRLAEVLGDRGIRVPFLIAAASYGAFFAFFTGLVTVIPSTAEPGVAIPSVSTILCCGPPGLTPGVVLLIAPSVQIAVNPLTLLLLALGLTLFAANVVVAIGLIRRGRSVGRSTMKGTAGVLGTLLFNCPSCGTVLLANALAGTAAAGALVGWAGLQAPLLASALPLSTGALWLSGRQLDRPMSCPQPST